MGKSSIEWTEQTWNPVTGCTHVSPGCDHCYAEAITNRFKRQAFSDVVLHPERLNEPRKVKEPSMFFTCSMGDLFHDQVPFDFVAQVFNVMESLPQHTFQVLTKRPGRMAYFAEHWRALWPPNVWAGTSVESQKYAHRLDVLARVPAQVRFVSVEPMLEAVNLSPWLAQSHQPDECGCETDASWCPDARRAGTLSWTIVGGESSPGARPFNIAWAEDLVRQCRDANVAVFCKQLGAKPYPLFGGTPLRDRKGGNWDEWPESLRVRQWPEVQHDHA